jgi:hypothetical protein
MEDGTLVDFRRNTIRPGEWVKGRPAANWLGRLKNQERFEVAAYRCTRCGYLKLYADRPATTSAWG